MDISRITDIDQLEKNFLGVPKGFLKTLPTNFETFVKEMRIKKKGGGVRIVHEALGPLKSANRRFLMNARDFFTISDASFGYTKGRSAQDNAAIHTGKVTVVKLDIKDFLGQLQP